MAHHLDLKYPNNTIKAKFMGYLKVDECPCNWEKNPMNFTEGNKKYKRVTE